MEKSVEKLKIGYFADGVWGHNALMKILNDPTLSIQFIVPRNDTKDLFLRDVSKERGIDYIEKVKVNSDEFYDLASKYNCDLFVSMSYNQIFRERIINLPRYKTINCHAGKLPFYRGRNILNWVLINDEKEFGITVHYVDLGIDTGDIILQRTFPITDDDDYNSLLNIAYDECPNILYDSIKLIQTQKAEVINQSDISVLGMYCGMRLVGDEIIDWNNSSREIFNFIRSISSPGPLATTYLNGVEIKINKAKFIPEAPKYIGINGQVIGIDGSSLVVKTEDSYLYILEYQSDIKIKVGDRFKNE